MFESARSDGALGVLCRFRAVLDELAGTDLSPLAGDELLDFTREWESIKRAGAVIDLRTVAELESRHLAAERGVQNTKSLLVDVLRIDPREAGKRIKDARNVGPRRALTGEHLEPIYPQTAAAIETGEISVDHARVVADLFDHIPPQTVEASAEIERIALDVAAVTYPQQMAKWAVQAASRIDPDGPRPNEDEIKRRRGLHLLDRADGSSKLTGELTAWATAALKAALGPLSAPAPAEDRARDDRSAAQRRHDGLQALCERVLRSGDLPPSHGAHTTILVTVDLRDLRRHWQARHTAPTDEQRQARYPS
jgi:hypothetical protein